MAVAPAVNSHCREFLKSLLEPSLFLNFVNDIPLSLCCLFTQESLLLYQMGNLEGCKQLSEDVCYQAVKFNSPNYNVIAGKAKSVLSGAYKQERRFTKAEEVLETSTEVGN